MGFRGFDPRGIVSYNATMGKWAGVKDLGITLHCLETNLNFFSLKIIPRREEGLTCIYPQINLVTGFNDGPENSFPHTIKYVFIER